MRYELAEASLQGNRHANEDRLGVAETPEGVLLVLADGLGGHPAGAEAAQRLVDTVLEAYRAAPRPLADPDTFFTRALERAHNALIELGDDSGRIPAATAVLCLVQGEAAFWAHVGDSRLYLFRDGLALARSRDHSYVEQLVRAGQLRRSDVERHPRRHQVTRCVGGTFEPPRPEFGTPRPLRPGDILLLCSDGLWGGIDDAQMGTILQQAALEDAVERLAANAEGNRAPHSDNISVVALRVAALGQAARTPAPADAPGNAEMRLQDAIANIEQALREYGPELKR